MKVLGPQVSVLCYPLKNGEDFGGNANQEKLASLFSLSPRTPSPLMAIQTGLLGPLVEAR